MLNSFNQEYIRDMAPIRDQTKLMPLGGDGLNVLVSFEDNRIIYVYINGHEINVESFDYYQIKDWHEDARAEERKFASMCQHEN